MTCTTASPESSLRGMLRSAYEVVTNSRYGCFSNPDRLAYRMRPEEALDLIQAIIEDGGGGNLVARLYTGTSKPTSQRPDGPMYAAILTCYHRNVGRNSVCVGKYEPRTRDEVWVEIDRRSHRNYQYWKVTKVWPKSKYPTKPSSRGKVVEGYILITNENMGNKHDERIFFGAVDDFPVGHLEEALEHAHQKLSGCSQ